MALKLTTDSGENRALPLKKKCRLAGFPSFYTPYGQIYNQPTNPPRKS